jgi:hypothetical protein
MGSFMIKARHRLSGNVHDIFCIDDYFGAHKYGYKPQTENGKVLTEGIFLELYTIEPNSEA